MLRAVWRQLVPSVWRGALWRWRSPQLRLVRRANREFARCRTQEERFQLANELLLENCPELVYTEIARIWTADEAFRQWYLSQCDPKNMHSMDRKYFLRELTKLTVKLPGDTAECGVYRGATSWLICEAFRGTGKWHFGFDSFEGLSTPGASDGDYWTEGALAAPEEEAAAYLVGQPATLLKGWIPERFPEVADRQFCFVHIDTDLYQPTRDAIEFFYPRMVPGGIIVGDDHGLSTCPGARRAFDEYQAGRLEPILHCTTGQGVIIKQ